MKYTLVIAALIGLVSIQEASAIALHHQTKLHDEDADHSTEYFEASEDGMNPLGQYQYTRVIPDQFSEESGNKFMTTIIKNFALEQKTADGKASGTFRMGKQQTQNASRMIVQKYKKMNGKDLDEYMTQYFQRTWEHFDVNNDEFLDVLDMTAFMKYILSDQNVNLDE